MTYLTKKKRKLAGKRLETFNKFWEVFNYKKGRAEAADAWLDIPVLTDAIFADILSGAKHEAVMRAKIIDRGLIPKMAQGWITARRWEDECEKSSEPVRVINTARSRVDDMARGYGILCGMGEKIFMKFAKDFKMPAEDIEAVLRKHTGKYDAN